MTIGGAPNVHTASSTNIGIVLDGSPTHPPAGSPNSCWMRSTMPSSMNIAFHTIAIDTLAPISDGGA